jgi:hypothetical protein
MSTWGKRCTAAVFLVGSRGNASETTQSEECDTTIKHTNCAILHLSVVDDHSATWIKVGFVRVCVVAHNRSCAGATGN